MKQLPTVFKPPTRRRRKTERRREQCRVNQARYRARKRSAERALGATVTQLQSDVLALFARRILLLRPLETCAAACRTTQALFDVLRHGLTNDERRVRQLTLLTAVFHEDVRIGDQRGRAAVVTQARAVTRETIHCVFPHLSPQYIALQNALIGQRLVCDATVFYEFGACGRIVDAEWTIDFVRALSAFLSIYDVACVLGDARIERNAYLMETVRTGAQERDVEHRWLEYLL